MNAKYSFRAITMSVALLLSACTGQAATTDPQPTQSTQSSPLQCNGRPVPLATEIYLAQDQTGNPVWLYVDRLNGTEYYATLFAVIEYPEGSGEFVLFQPTAAVLPPDGITLNHEGVAVRVQQCFSGYILFNLTGKPSKWKFWR